jgi:hypothetical protein
VGVVGWALHVERTDATRYANANPHKLSASTLHVNLGHATDTCDPRSMKSALLATAHSVARAVFLTAKAHPLASVRIGLFRQLTCSQYRSKVCNYIPSISLTSRTPLIRQLCSSHTEAGCTTLTLDEDQPDAMGDTKSISTTSSGDKKRKRGAPAYFAVRKGKTPGIYFSWTDAQEQILGFSGAECTYVSIYSQIRPI